MVYAFLPALSQLGIACSAHSWLPANIYKTYMVLKTLMVKFNETSLKGSLSQLKARKCLFPIACNRAQNHLAPNEAV
jgi:hypothetical protein